MATSSAPAGGGSGSTGPPSGPTNWVGVAVFGGCMMAILGASHAMQGLVAIFNDDYFVVGKQKLLVDVDYTVWGWTHLVLGLVVAGSGLALVAGRRWARVVAVVTAVLSAILNLGFLSAYPIWSALMIALDVLVIWAVTVHGRELDYL